MLNWEWARRYLEASLAQSLWVLGALAVLFVLFWLAGPRLAAAQSFTWEFALVFALRALWQFVGARVRTRSGAAVHRAEQIQSLQHWLHLPDELAIQHLVLPHHALVWALNAYYATVHLDGMLVFLIWIWWRRRDQFRPIRNVLAAATAICLLIQTVPVAPPRLLPGSGFVDTALVYGQSVYGTYQAGLDAQLTAMPSVHIAWAFLIAWYLARLGRGSGRAIGVVHLAVTFVVIVATANHWWLDGFVAIGVVLLVIAVHHQFRRAWPARPARQQAGSPPWSGTPSGRETISA